MDWFRDLTGFAEMGYRATRERLRVDGRTLQSLPNGRCFNIGELKTPSLKELRALAASALRRASKPKVENLYGNVRDMHSYPEFGGALFQVASQFNLLEMVDPTVTPEDGVTCYQWDNTQGPACAIAAGAATIYRNYFAPVAGLEGQTVARQFDMLSDLGELLSERLGRSVNDLYMMRNGYALASPEGLTAIGQHLSACSPSGRDALREKLRIGLHFDVDVTDASAEPLPRVNQAFCSALPVAYSACSSELWEPFARLVLEAAYEATLLAGVISQRQSGSNIALLTRLGGGAFGNDNLWIEQAIERALEVVGGLELDVRVVNRARPTVDLISMSADPPF